MKFEIEKFEAYLRNDNKSENTITLYLFSANQFISRYDGELNRTTLKDYRNYLRDNFSIKTCNARLNGINLYIEKVLKKPQMKIDYLKEQQKPFLENVISDADYEYFKKCLDTPATKYWYFVIRFLAATGARIHEFIQFKVEHVKRGHVDLYGKGAKMRRIYFPAALQKDALSWLSEIGRDSGFIFVNKNGKLITPRGIAHQLKEFAKKFKIPTEVVYPHSFRHRFAKNFLEKYKDISFLADLMGHSSIETTRIYLRKTATEQREVVDQIITW